MGQEKERKARLSALERKIGHRFRKKDILRSALTHPSSPPEAVKGQRWSYETMEFFGDAILNFIISDMIFRRERSLGEGEMTKIRSMIVSSKSLAVAAQKIGLGKHIVFGRGEEKSGGSRKESILTATFEALIAAVYLDAGMTRTKKFLEKIFGKEIDDVVYSKESGLYEMDVKSILQEILHKRGEPLPEYVVVKEEGPAHEKQFSVVLRIRGERVSEGMGRSKKEAEKDAAKKALDIMQKETR